MRRHYSHKKSTYYKDLVRYGFSGQGESLILMTTDCKALFGWNKSKQRDDGQEGVNCFVFRNEGEILSSELIKEACELAWKRWHGERLFTYVNAKKIKSDNPGYCFKMAGWSYCGKSKGGLDILEILQC
jgi:hypothetical protein